MSYRLYIYVALGVIYEHVVKSLIPATPHTLTHTLWPWQRLSPVGSRCSQPHDRFFQYHIKMFPLSAGSCAKTTQPTSLCPAFRWFHWDGGQSPWQLKAHSDYWLADPFLSGVSGLSHRCNPQCSIAPRKMHHLRFLFRCGCSKC